MMQVEIEWAEPIKLRSLSEEDTDRILQRLKSEPGIYVFARKWGSSHKALYVGQAQKISSRVAQQLNNHKLRTHIEDAKLGSKVLLVGYLKYRGYTNIKKSLNAAERAYIRFCVAEGHFLHNKLGTRIQTDEILSSGGKKRPLFPAKLEVEKS